VQRLMRSPTEGRIIMRIQEQCSVLMWCWELTG